MPPVDLMQALLQGRKLGQMGFWRLQLELELASFTGLEAAQQEQLLSNLGVAEYRGDGISGVVSFFCDGSGPACLPCQHLSTSRALDDRARAKGEKLAQLCSTSSSHDVHTAFGKQRMATMTAVELMYKVCGAKGRVAGRCTWVPISHACASVASGRL